MAQDRKREAASPAGKAAHPNKQLCCPPTPSPPLATPPSPMTPPPIRPTMEASPARYVPAADAGGDARQTQGPDDDDDAELLPSDIFRNVRVECRDDKAAIAMARRALNEAPQTADGTTNLLFFCDASKKDYQASQSSRPPVGPRSLSIKNMRQSVGGFGIVSRLHEHDNPRITANTGYKVESCHEVYQVELTAVAECFGITKHQMPDIKGDGQIRVRIFTDSWTSVMRAMRYRESVEAGTDTQGLVAVITKPILHMMAQMAKTMDDGRTTFEIHWLPRDQIGEHKLADDIAYRACNDPDFPTTARETEGLEDMVDAALEEYYSA